METLKMSAKERGRVGVMTQVKKGLRLVEAARLMRVSYRQAKRIWRRYQQAGDRGLVHGHPGRVSNRKRPEEERQRIVERYLERYLGFGPPLAAEHLPADDHLVVDHETLRRWLLAPLSAPPGASAAAGANRTLCNCMNVSLQAVQAGIAFFGSVITGVHVIGWTTSIICLGLIGILPSIFVRERYY